MMTTLSSNYYEDFLGFYHDTTRHLPFANISHLSKCISCRILFDPTTNVVLGIIGVLAGMPTSIKK